jgi:cytochrome c553
MVLSISKTKNVGGRPRTDATPVMVRLPPSAIASLDAWIAAQPEPRPSRPEAIRRLLAQALGKGVDAGSIAGEDLNASNDE